MSCYSRRSVPGVVGVIEAKTVHVPRSSGHTLRPGCVVRVRPLADWRQQTRFLIAVAGLSVLVIAVILLLVIRKLAQQHRLSQQQLTLEKQRLDTAVNNIPQGLILYDTSALSKVCNRRYIDMFGLSQEVAKPGCTDPLSSSA